MSEKRLNRENFLLGTAKLAAAGTGIGLLTPRAVAAVRDVAAGEIKRGGVLRIAYSSGGVADTTDPTTQIGNAATWLGLCGVYDRLVHVEPLSWTPTPRLAVSWKASADAKKWTLRLRPGVKFHNGKTLDSRDVAWSFRHILDKKVGSSAYAALSAILNPSGIQTPSRDTVVLNLKKPDSLLPIFLGAYQLSIFPNGVDPKKNPIGTGPFKLKSFKATLGFELERNPNFWNRPYPYLDGVRGVYVPDQNTKALAVTNGSMDLSDTMPFTQVGNITGKPNLKLLRLAGASFHAFAFDTTQEPFNDPRVVQAIKMALDRRAIVQAAIQGIGTPTGDVPEPTADYFYPPARGVPAQDIAGARRLLAAAGHGNGLSFPMAVSDFTPGIVNMVVALKQVLAPAGIDMTINTFPADTYFSAAWMKTPAFTSNWVRRHPHDILDLLYRSGAAWNESRFKSPQLDSLIDRGAATVNLLKQRSIYRAALNMVATQSGECIPYFLTSAHVAKRKVNGVIVDTQQMLIVERAWLS